MKTPTDHKKNNGGGSGQGGHWGSPKQKSAAGEIPKLRTVENGGKSMPSGKSGSSKQSFAAVEMPKLHKKVNGSGSRLGRKSGSSKQSSVAVEMLKLCMNEQDMGNGQGGYSEPRNSVRNAVASIEITRLSEKSGGCNQGINEGWQDTKQHGTAGKKPKSGEGNKRSKDDKSENSGWQETKQNGAAGKKPKSGEGNKRGEDGQSENAGWQDTKQNGAAGMKPKSGEGNKRGEDSQSENAGWQDTKQHSIAGKKPKSGEGTKRGEDSQSENSGRQDTKQKASADETSQSSSENKPEENSQNENSGLRELQQDIAAAIEKLKSGKSSKNTENGQNKESSPQDSEQNTSADEMPKSNKEKKRSGNGQSRNMALRNSKQDIAAASEMPKLGKSKQGGKRGQNKNSSSQDSEQDDAADEIPQSGEKNKSGSSSRALYEGPLDTERVAAAFGDSGDFVKRPVAVGGDVSRTVTLCFVDGLVSGSDISEAVIRPLTSRERFGGKESEEEVIELMQSGAVYGSTVHVRSDLKDVLSDLLAGYCAVVFDKEKKAVTFEMKSSEKRGIEHPKEEKVVKGSGDSFVETIRTNTMLLRKHFRDPKLRIKEYTLGTHSHTRTAVVYIEDYTNPEIIKKTEERLQQINLEGLLTSAAIEDCIIDVPKSPFPQLIITERPDKFCLNLLEGRVGILVDGLPMGYMAPGTFAQMFKVSDDVANHFVVATILTVLRYMALLLTLFLPAIYTAVAMYHQEMLPMKLMQAIIESKQSVPFPTAVEVLAMLLAFELLQEAGLRLPSSIGQTVSIVGALIVGQSAVEAKVVSPVVVIVVAMAGIAGFTSPDQDMGNALRIWRFLLVIGAILGGMFGLSAAAVVLIYHLCSLESFNVPYMTPFAGSSNQHALRAFVRYPIYKAKPREPALGVRLGGDERK